MRVGIIGGGIGGLSTAVGLQRAGIDVAVFERSDAPRVSGSGLSVFGNGIAALDAIGLGDRFRDVTRGPAAGLRGGQRRPDGRWLTLVPVEDAGELRIVHRRVLHDLLLGALEPGTVRWDAPARVVGDGGTVEVGGTGAANGVTERFDVVVAADGLRSAVRASWPGDPGIRYSGYSAWRGVTREPVDLLGGAGETWGRGLRFGIAPLPDDCVYWFAVATMPRDEAVADEFARVEELFGGWHEPIPALLAATDPAEVFRLPIEDLAGPAPTFRRGRVVLLGDAAHAMTPDLGQGGGQALEDAATLAALLAPIAGRDRAADAGGSDARTADAGTVDAGTADARGVDAGTVDARGSDAIDAGLAAYDRLRRRRTQPIARRARLVGAVGQARTPWRAALRDAVLRATPASAMARQMDSLQHWAPPVP
ncbi:FAD-dependent monooxygenase [Microbacterium sp. No. 7]|uniref:FAD-dependent monooxygenase n=1 Tax=Microbacterium sp. No. 7 TaxID=1714373 RepID=UPI0006D2C75B|nr:FAD-dependent monooxygenase [Microbacterium sp. No. 7]ALJ21745.1 monooxygenase [Microbacterium sp. No. 7]